MRQRLLVRFFDILELAGLDDTKMQGLQNYADISSPETSPRRLSSNGASKTTQRPNAVASSSKAVSPSSEPRRPRMSTGKGKAVDTPSNTASSLPPRATASTTDVHTPAKNVAEPPTSERGRFDGMTDDEVLRIISRPVEDIKDWGIPAAVPSEQADERLKAKVAKFLDMKYNDDQHINTTLLSSTAFANPHIYAKLVDFVAIDETASAFPNGGWLTRQGLESKKGPWGPSAMSEAQRQEAQAIKASQERGVRKSVEFSKGRKERTKEREKPYRR